MDRDIEARLVRYLLGELAEAEERELEQRYFQDDFLFERLQQAETELVDAYVRGELGPKQREALEKRFLSSLRGKKRLGLSRSLHGLAASRGTALISRARAGRSPGTPSFALRLLLPAAAVLVCALALILWRTQTGAPGGQGIARQPTAQARRDAGLSPETGPAEGGEPDLLAFALMPGLTRDGGPPRTFQVPAGTERVRLQVQLATVLSGNCRAVISTVEGRELLHTDSIMRRIEGGTMVDVDVPAVSLGTGDYILTLSARSGGGAFEEVADCFFRVVWKK